MRVPWRITYRRRGTVVCTQISAETREDAENEFLRRNARYSDIEIVAITRA